MDFYKTGEWLSLRYRVLRKYGRRCMLCAQEGGAMHVDHVKPRSRYPELALDPGNLQVLCADCNLGKSNRDTCDFREAGGRCKTCWEPIEERGKAARQGYCSRKCRRDALKKLEFQHCAACSKQLPRNLSEDKPQHLNLGYCSKRCLRTRRAENPTGVKYSCNTRTRRVGALGDQA